MLDVEKLSDEYLKEEFFKFKREMECRGFSIEVVKCYLEEIIAIARTQAGEVSDDFEDIHELAEKCIRIIEKEEIITEYTK